MHGDIFKLVVDYVRHKRTGITVAGVRKIYPDLLSATIGSCLNTMVDRGGMKKEGPKRKYVYEVVKGNLLVVLKGGVAKGGRRTGNDHYYRLRKFFNEKPVWLSVRTLVEVTGVPMPVVSTFVLREHERGKLERRKFSGKYRYRTKTGYFSPWRNFSKGEIADSVWRIFTYAIAPMTKTEIWKILRLRSKKYTWQNVHVLVHRWYKQGYLKRRGSGYFIPKLHLKRPSASANIK